MGDNVPSFPDESVITNDSASSTFPTNTTTTTNTNTTTTQIPPITNTPKPKSNRGKVIATLFGILLLIGGIGAGIFLVGQQQLFNQKAASNLQCYFNGQISTTTGKCGTPPTCPSGYKYDGFGKCNISIAPQTGVPSSISACPNGTTFGGDPYNACIIGGSTCHTSGDCNGTDTSCVANGTATDDVKKCCSKNGTAVTGGPSSGPLGYICAASGSGSGGGSSGGGSTGGACSGDCFGPTYNGVAVNNCGSVGRPNGTGSCSNGQICCAPPGGGGGGGGGGSSNEPITRTCGEPCDNDAQCQRNKSNSACQHNVCVNTACPTQTQKGANCACTNKVSCGQPTILGQSCTSGSEQGFINIDNKNKCTSYEVKSGQGTNSHQFCMPTNPTHGYKLIVSCTDIKIHNLSKPDGSITGLTQQDILTACSAEATAPPNTASCSNVTAYDSNWSQLSSAQLAALSAGSVVNFTVKGTTTTSFDKAKFTINGTDQGETTTVKPGATQEYYVQYTIPANTTSFTITAQVHDSGTNAWY